MVKNGLYLNRIFCLTLVIVFLECKCCHNILACCSAKKTDVKKEPSSQEDEKGCAFLHKSPYVPNKGISYIHHLYCSEKGFFYKFFLQQYTTSRTYYLCWTLFEHVLKKLTGVVWIYKNVGNWEFYYGSVIGLGWYPQCLRFSKLRAGFFDMFVNFTSVFMLCCHFFCHRYFIKCSKEFMDVYGNSFSSDVLIEENSKTMLDKYKEIFDKMNYFLYFKSELSSIYQSCYPFMKLKKILPLVLKKILPLVIAIFFLFSDFSLVNIKTCYGLKVKILTLQQILKFSKRRGCLFISNICRISRINGDGKNEVFIYRYKYHSHFFFGERDHIFWLLLELFIPNIEICLNHDNF